MFTFPVFADEVIETTVGADGLLTAAWEIDGNNKPSVTVATNKTKRPLFTRKASHGTYVLATHAGYVFHLERRLRVSSSQP